LVLAMFIQNVIHVNTANLSHLKIAAILVVRWIIYCLKNFLKNTHYRLLANLINISFKLKGYQWTGVPNIILFHQDNNGDENFRLYKVNITNVNIFRIF